MNADMNRNDQRARVRKLNFVSSRNLDLCSIVTPLSLHSSLAHYFSITVAVCH